jgi:hypothetical protein
LNNGNAVYPSNDGLKKKAEDVVTLGETATVGGLGVMAIAAAALV